MNHLGSLLGCLTPCCHVSSADFYHPLNLSRSPATWKLSGKQPTHSEDGHTHRLHTIYDEIPDRCYVVDDNNTQTHTCIERWVKFNTHVISWLICNTFMPYIVERDQFASVSCAHNHMWLTCLPLESTVLPWWAPQAQSTQEFPWYVIRLGQWVTDLAHKSTHNSTSYKHGLRQKEKGSGIN